MNQRTITVIILGCLTVFGSASLDASVATSIVTWGKAHRKAIGFSVGAVLFQNFIVSKFSGSRVDAADRTFKGEARALRRLYFLSENEINDMRNPVRLALRQHRYRDWMDCYRELMQAGDLLERACLYSYDTYWTKLFGKKQDYSRHAGLQLYDKLRENDEQHYHADLVWPVAPGTAARNMTFAARGLPLNAHEVRWLDHMESVMKILHERQALR